jgi:hypothetical protein
MFMPRFGDPVDLDICYSCSGGMTNGPKQEKGNRKTAWGVFFVFVICGVIVLLAIKRPESKYLTKIIDQTELAKIAIEGEDSLIRLAAFEQITDQAILGKLVIDSPVFCVAALEKLTDQAVIAKLAIEERESEYIQIALERIIDQALLAKVAQEGGGLGYRMVAVRKLTDQVLLAKVALENDIDKVRIGAVEKLKDPALLRKIVMNESEDSRVREAAKFRLAIIDRLHSLSGK